MSLWEQRVLPGPRVREWVLRGLIRARRCRQAIDESAFHTHRCHCGIDSFCEFRQFVLKKSFPGAPLPHSRILIFVRRISGSVALRFRRRTMSRTPSRVTRHGSSWLKQDLTFPGSGRSAAQRPLGTNSVFKGNKLALTSITIITGVNLEGRALARNGAVTLDTDVITGCACQ